jgi:asparagine synthetase B (glutamine-hydrolysing)
MCGIFGFIASKGSRCGRPVFQGALSGLFRLSEPRGREASGLVVAINGTAQVFKRGTAPSRMLGSKEYKSYLDAALRALKIGDDGRLREPAAVIGHCRLVTAGSEAISGNNQPIIAGHSVGVHNGIVTNDRSLWRRHPEIHQALDSDSEVIFRLIDRHCDEGPDVPAAVAGTFREIEGAASIAFFRDDTDALTLATNTGSLYYAHLDDVGVFVFSSERFILESFLAENPFASAVQGAAVRQLAAGTGCVAGFADARPGVFPLNGAAAGAPPAAGAAAARRANKPAIVIEDRTDRIADVRRCSKCILPESYPFIEFDEAGVCNFCRDYEPQKPKGRDALESILAPHRRSDGRPDCIVAFSGGRDSSYGLHYIKTELGMNPIALTYDWGMVTDIARRNQARICGKLGVEHVLRAADIPAKRRYIRKNIEAWLARPALGMVPLFMAGDKMFFHYLRELKKQTGIPLVLFCGGNLMERTDFKAGFAGVRENQHGNRLFALSASNKAGLFLWYALQYLLNPRYFNESFFDTMWAYFTTFIEKEDFIYLYHYIKWDENVINDTLAAEYGWEKAEGRSTTWRIGDGYTSFINYIYYTVAGFSEYDTFRSCQVREGLLGRDQALRLSAEDNKPHIEALADFARHTGFNLEEVLTRINSIEKRY